MLHLIILQVRIFVDVLYYFGRLRKKYQEPLLRCRKITHQTKSLSVRKITVPVINTLYSYVSPETALKTREVCRNPGRFPYCENTSLSSRKRFCSIFVWNILHTHVSTNTQQTDSRFFLSARRLQYCHQNNYRPK